MDGHAKGEEGGPTNQPASQPTIQPKGAKTDEFAQPRSKGGGMRGRKGRKKIILKSGESATTDRPSFAM